MLAERSHIGWMREKQAQGFADHAWPADWREGVKHAETCPTPLAQHHADMLPYADLGESVKEYDRVTVRGVLDGISEAGYRLVKDG
jgi:hypothetical protein